MQLLSRKSRADGRAQLDMVNLLKYRTAFNQWNVPVIRPYMASSIKLISNAPARRHKACRLRNRANSVRISTKSATHSKTTHMTLKCCDPFAVQQFVNASNRPAPGTPRVLVKSMPPVCHLISVLLTTELNVPNRLELCRLESSHPFRGHTVHSVYSTLEEETSTCTVGCL